MMAEHLAFLFVKVMQHNNRARDSCDAALASSKASMDIANRVEPMKDYSRRSLYANEFANIAYKATEATSTRFFSAINYATNATTPVPLAAANAAAAAEAAEAAALAASIAKKLESSATSWAATFHKLCNSDISPIILASADRAAQQSIEARRAAISSSMAAVDKAMEIIGLQRKNIEQHCTIYSLDFMDIAIKACRVATDCLHTVRTLENRTSAAAEAATAQQAAKAAVLAAAAVARLQSSPASWPLQFQRLNLNGTKHRCGRCMWYPYLQIRRIING